MLNKAEITNMRKENAPGALTITWKILAMENTSLVFCTFIHYSTVYLEQEHPAIHILQTYPGFAENYMRRI